MTADSGPSADLLGRLAVIERRVRSAVAARRRTDPDPDDAFRGVYLTPAHVDRLLTDPPARTRTAAAEAGPMPPPAEAGPMPPAGGTPTGGRLPRVAAEFRLTDVDVDVLLVAMAPDLDPRFEKLYGYLHDDVTRRRASIGLAIELALSSPVDHRARGRFDESAPLVRGGLLVVEEPDRPYLTRSLRVPDRVTSYLLGCPGVDPALTAVRRSPRGLPSAEGAYLARVLDSGAALVHCRQPPGSWCASAAAAALAAQGGTIVVDLSLCPAVQAGELLALAVRDARLLGRVLVAGPVDHLDRPAVRRATADCARLVLYGTAPWDPALAESGALCLDLHDLARTPVPQLWTDLLADAGTQREVAAFRLSPDQVARAVSAATVHAAAEGVPVEGRHLTAGARTQNSTGLGRLARRVEPSVAWSDLVLPPTPMSALRHLTDRVRWRHRVLGDWRLRRSGGRGEGVTALFAGEPGTGKTMAAEVVAGDLGLDLYVIDLSSVVDKYIGETEKNLERVFAGAEGVNGVLFFDEADALFGKRSDVSDAHDRYANLEVAYLLQRMESFDGLAILATNLRANLDDAFARRLSLIVEFTAPDATRRRQLWEKSFAAVPLGADVDLDFCAEAFELAGGDIRNVAVTAAYLAAAEGGAADMRHVVRAVRDEYRKHGRMCVEAEFGPYYPLLSGVA